MYTEIVSNLVLIDLAIATRVYKYSSLIELDSMIIIIRLKDEKKSFNTYFLFSLRNK